MALLTVILATAMSGRADAGGNTAADAASGFSHRFEYSGEVFADVHGGMRRGSVYTGLAHLSLDWSGANATTDGWLAHADFYAPHGDSLSQCYVGDFSVVSNIDAVHQLRVNELWAQRSLDHASLRAGLLSADTEFWGSDTADLFISSAFGAPSVISGDLPHSPIFPQGVLGARLAFDLGNAATLRVAVLDGDGGDLANDNRHGLNISLGQGALLLAEYQRVFATAGDLKTTLRLAGYHHSGHFIDTRGDAVRGNDGFIGSVDRAMSARLNVFARIGMARSDRSAVPWEMETGFNLSPVFGADDTFGLALAYVDLNRNPAVTGTPTPLRHEIILESTLDWPLNKWLELQPDLQYIVDPGGTATAHNALVIGLRATLRL